MHDAGKCPHRLTLAPWQADCSATCGMLRLPTFFPPRAQQTHLVSQLRHPTDGFLVPMNFIAIQLPLQTTCLTRQDLSIFTCICARHAFAQSDGSDPELVHPLWDSSQSRRI
jgi:hypothetical protein